MALSKKLVNNLQLTAAAICCSVTALMMAVSTYALMPTAFFGVVMALATIALDGMHYLSWPLARWKIQEGRYGLAGLLIFCGGSIACFSITATSNQMIQVLLSDTTMHEADLKVRLPALQDKVAVLTRDLQSTVFAEHVVSNQAAIRADIADTRKEASSYRQSGRMRNAEATEAVADNKEASLGKQLEDVDQWNAIESRRVETQRASIKTEIDQAQSEIYAINAKSPRNVGVPTDVLEWLLRGFAAALVIFPSVILSSLSVGAVALRNERLKASTDSYEQAPEPLAVSAPVDETSLPDEMITREDTEHLVQLSAHQGALAAEVAHKVGNEVPSDLIDLYSSLETLVGRAQPGDSIGMVRVAKELRTSTKRLVRVYPFAKQRGLLEQTALGRWVKPLAA
jgi:hypothetical protein